MKNIFPKGVLVAAICLTAQNAYAQNMAGEENFQNVFVVAGYSAAYGAALGAAALPFTRSPMSNLNFIAAGASLGFVAGSLVAIYQAAQQQANPQFQPYGMPQDDMGYQEQSENFVPANSALVQGYKGKLAFGFPNVYVAPNQGAIQVLNWSF